MQKRALSAKVSAQEQSHIQALSAITSDFYRRETASFSHTRLQGWEGWETVEPDLNSFASTLPHPQILFDIGCGNLRFERSCSSALSGMKVYAFDNCTPLTTSCPLDDTSIDLHLYSFDIMQGLLHYAKTLELARPLQDLPAPQMLVCFGVMHHLPTQRLRLIYMRMLADLMGDHGWIALSFWRFLEDEKLRIKADHSHRAALKLLNEGSLPCSSLSRAANADVQQAYKAVVPHLFEPTDRLLGWGSAHNVLRFCHSFNSGEIDELQAALLERLPPTAHARRFFADGKRIPLNEYLIVRW